MPLFVWLLLASAAEALASESEASSSYKYDYGYDSDGNLEKNSSAPESEALSAYEYEFGCIGCGTETVFVGPHREGHITSPGYLYREDYPLSCSCRWHVSAEPGYAIRAISGSNFETEATFDTLFFFDANGELLKKCSGNTCDDVTTATGVMWIGFRSDDSIAKRGFRVTFTAVRKRPAGGDGSIDRRSSVSTGSTAPDSRPFKSALLVDQPPRETSEEEEAVCNGCGLTTTFFVGPLRENHITSPGYTWKDYPPSCVCRWRVLAESGYAIRAISGSNFETESTFDTLSFFDANGELLNTCSGNTCDDVTTATKEMRIVFRSDDSITKRGFRVSLKAVGRGSSVSTGFTLPDALRQNNNLLPFLFLILLAVLVPILYCFRLECRRAWRETRARRAAREEEGLERLHRRSATMRPRVQSLNARPPPPRMAPSGSDASADVAISSPPAYLDVAFTPPPPPYATVAAPSHPPPAYARL